MAGFLLLSRRPMRRAGYPVWEQGRGITMGLKKLRIRESRCFSEVSSLEMCVPEKGSL